MGLYKGKGRPDTLISLFVQCKVTPLDPSGVGDNDYV